MWTRRPTNYAWENNYLGAIVVRRTSSSQTERTLEFMNSNVAVWPELRDA